MRHHAKVCCDWSNRDAENARHEIAGHENAAPCYRGGKCETWKCEKRDSMEHRVLHMSVHCRAGMHESTRKNTRFRRQLCSCERRICAKCVSSSNVMHDLRLCHVGISDSVRRASPSWNNRRAGAPSAGLRLPWFCICTSLTVMTWTIISWCWLSVTNVFLTFTQVVQSVVLSIVLHWLYIHYSILFRVYLPS